MTENKNIIRLLNIANGQITGIVKMIEEGKSYVDISNQVLASIALLKQANVEIISQHLTKSVGECFQKGEKPDEVIRDIMTRNVAKIIK